METCKTAMTTDGDLAGLHQLLAQAHDADAETRIELRDPIATYGRSAIEAVEPWVTDAVLGAFAVRVLEAIARRGEAPPVVAALQASWGRAPSETIRCDIEAALGRIGVALLPPDDGSLELEASEDAERGPADEERTGTPASQEPRGRPERVREAVRVWTQQLMDVGGRNNLLFFRDLQRGTLDLGAARPESVDSLLAGRAVRLSALFMLPRLEEDAARRARAIHAKAREHYEERGIATLHFACGLATWRNARTPTVPAAPVLVRPARLTPRGASSDDFEITLVGDMEVNPTLLHVLTAEYGVRFDHEELLGRLDGAIDTRAEVADVYRWLRRQAAAVAGFAVCDKFVLGNFTYAKLPMVQDLAFSEDALVEHDLIAAIAGDAEARRLLQERYAAVTVAIDEPDRTPPQDEFVVLDADSSQSYAVNAVVRGQDLIVKGPPGTGKSQTIANLITTLLARGKSVLFVAEKRAAIDAVLRRLTKVGLDDLVFDLHGGAQNRRELAQALARSLAMVSATPLVIEAEADTYARSRSLLNGYVGALHRERAPWGISVYEAYVRLAAMPNAAESRTRLRGPVLDALGAPAFAGARTLVSELDALGAFGAEVLDSDWAHAALDSSDEAAAIFGRVRALARELPTLGTDLQRAATLGGTLAPTAFSGWNAQFELWRAATRAARALTPAVYGLPLADLQPALALGEGSGLRRVWARISSRAYREAVAAIRACAIVADAPESTLIDTALAAHTAHTIDRDLGHADGPPVAPEDAETMQSRHAAALRELDELGQAVGIPLAVADDPGSVLDKLVVERTVAIRLPEVRAKRLALVESGLAELLVELEHDRPARGVPVHRLEYAWYRSIIERLAFAEPVIGAFDAARHWEVVTEYRRLDHGHISNTAARVRRIYAERVVNAKARYRDEAAAVTFQANLKRRHLPLRQLYAAAPHMLQALKPCWAMSPLMVSQLLPPERGLFDVVVFDEASQVTPADAVPAILRGVQVVVAGDERQLPPTAFFVTSSPEDESQEENEQLQLDLAATRGFDSILESLQAFLPFRMLEWHYRSLDERLIAFSNMQFYNRALTTFPGTLGDDCLEHVLVPHRPGLANQEESVTAEVAEVVRRVIAHAQKRPTETLGVIALGITHANRITEALRLEQRRHPELDAFFAEAVDEPFFVKNLERVQGDERDAIILSVGYGKTADGRLLYRFGPINQQGGERRLNVAITRARCRMTVVSSFASADMDPQRAASRGARVLRAFLAYAESHGLGGAPLAPAEPPRLNAFELDVQDALTKAGIPLVAQLGVSGYSIDFAAQHPRRPGQFVLAIEADGASYHSTPTARDRDRLRQEQLERLGWRFHRIWSVDWFQNRQAATERVLEAYQAALRAVDTPQALGSLKAPTRSAQPTITLPQRGVRPLIGRRAAITDYYPSELVALVDWVESDTLLRSEAQLVDELTRELGFRRRGSRIQAALIRAIRMARQRRKPVGKV